MINFNRGVPPEESFPTKQISECAQTVLAQHGDVILQYGKARGYSGLRELIASKARIKANQVLLSQGSLQLLDLTARLIIKPGDFAYVESPTYDRALQILRRAEAQVIGIPMNHDGVDVNFIESRLKAGDIPVLMYLIPDFQNPCGTVLTHSRREHLVALAQRYNFLLVEDTPYRELRYRGDDIPSLFEFAPDQVVQISSFSKLISPGLRVGYAIIPETLEKTLVKAAEDTYINASYFNQAIVADFIQRGWLKQQLSMLKALYEPRLDALLHSLEKNLSGLATWTHPEGGFFVGASFSERISTQELRQRALQTGISLSDGRGFFLNDGGEHFIRLPFCALTPDEIVVAVSRIAEVAHGIN